MRPKIMTGKFIFLIAALLLGGGILAASIMTPPPAQATANAASEAAVPVPVTLKSESAFLDYDIVIGDKNAPVEIIEYAAISCSHCADFHKQIYPELKRKYLDTGKAKLVYRNFIFDSPFDVFAASLSRCVTEAEFLPTMEAYFNSQPVWNNVVELRRIFEADGREKALAFARSEVAKAGEAVGITPEQARACFKNEAVIDYLLKVRQEAVAKYDVQSTPTLIVAGRKMEHHDMASLAKAIEDAIEQGN